MLVRQFLVLIKDMSKGLLTGRLPTLCAKCSVGKLEYMLKTGHEGDEPRRYHRKLRELGTTQTVELYVLEIIDGLITAYLGAQKV